MKSQNPPKSIEILDIHRSAMSVEGYDNVEKTQKHENCVFQHCFMPETVRNQLGTPVVTTPTAHTAPIWPDADIRKSVYFLEK